MDTWGTWGGGGVEHPKYFGEQCSFVLKQWKNVMFSWQNNRLPPLPLPQHLTMCLPLEEVFEICDISNSEGKNRKARLLRIL